MAEDRREQAFGVRARQGELVGVADAGRLDLDQHLALARSFEVDLHDLERLACGNGDGGAGFHRRLLPVICGAKLSGFAWPINPGRGAAGPIRAV